MFEFIAARLGFWAMVVLWGLIGFSASIILFTKLGNKLPKVLIKIATHSFRIISILGAVLFLVALTVKAWA